MAVTLCWWSSCPGETGVRWTIRRALDQLEEGADG